MHHSTTSVRSKHILLSPGIVNRTFENRTQSNSIELNPLRLISAIERKADDGQSLLERFEDHVYN